MEVTKEWLEAKIAELNTDLQHQNVSQYGKIMLTQRRNYYVNKLIELEEKQLNKISV
ncbi:hypothetical protein FNO01nite_30190 [Flavobacterium noncentrifugens]|uniref:Uncharacterized protein n=1 Tax=Flavobacterium noncentrifugens TaxID=1128970 RepID=A0A1G9BSU5_9FLAO|nr:hypothetical protein FNO01nite_30190 [Flavobacterium noncentrifugens]SDK42244.1 hypothetical protein SAMN04487935_3331 [Flavobacterium noncentrifugens]